jgi:hypothetical protein
MLPYTRSSLQFFISELLPKAQRYLAILGYQVSDEILAKAGPEVLSATPTPVPSPGRKR